jgi:ABC-type transporter Mla MlaB component
MAIYIHDETARLRLRVTGELDEASARQLASCWTTASSVVGSRKVVVDLRTLAAVQAAGTDLLEALHREGVEFLASSEFQTQLVAEITGAARRTNPAGPSVRGWLAQSPRDAMAEG